MNWTQIVEEAPRRGERITEEGRKYDIGGNFNLTEMRAAKDWKQCPVGQLKKPVHPDGPPYFGCPVDRDLVDIGFRFSEAIRTDDFKAARKMLRAIEESK